MAFCAAIATAVIVGACGSGVPGNAVAVVGGRAITKDALTHWLNVANDATQASTGQKAPPLPVPPNYTACVAAERGNGTATSQTTAALKQTCAQNYQQLLSTVLNYLIQAIWVQGEARDRGVKVSQAAVEKSYEQQRKTSNPSLATTAELDTFLAKSGQTVQDLKWRTYLNLLANGIQLKVEKAASHVSNAQISAYYAKNKATQFTTPVTLDLHLIETNSLTTANTVKSKLAAGITYANLASRYSIDTTTKALGGRDTAVREGVLPSQVWAVAIKAKVGALNGPVKTPFGYYVFTVDKVNPAVVQTLAQAKATIKAQLASTQEQAASTTLQSEFSKKWTARSKCASGYEVSSCSNAPKTTSTGATGATG